MHIHRIHIILSLSLYSFPSKLHSLQLYLIWYQLVKLIIIHMIDAFSPNMSLHTTQEIEMKRHSGNVITNDGSDSDEDHSKQQLVVRKKYGNMKVLYNGKRPITLGPDYLCFIPTFLAFCIVSYFLSQLVFSSTENIYFRIVTIFITFGHPLSYLWVATSNPGIVTQSALTLPEQDRKKCSKCVMVVPRHARHCNDCDVCIEHYDHHCPWTSKCIGGGNLIQFYIFLAWTPIYLIYITVAFVACMSANLVKIQQIPKTI